jgi:hypothetical protein
MESVDFPSFGNNVPKSRSSFSDSVLFFRNRESGGCFGSKGIAVIAMQNE